MFIDENGPKSLLGITPAGYSIFHFCAKFGTSANMKKLFDFAQKVRDGEDESPKTKKLKLVGNLDPEKIAEAILIVLLRVSFPFDLTAEQTLGILGTFGSRVCSRDRWRFGLAEGNDLWRRFGFHTRDWFDQVYGHSFPLGWWFVITGLVTNKFSLPLWLITWKSLQLWNSHLIRSAKGNGISTLRIVTVKLYYIMQFWREIKKWSNVFVTLMTSTWMPSISMGMFHVTWPLDWQCFRFTLWVTCDWKWGDWNVAKLLLNQRKLRRNLTWRSWTPKISRLTRWQSPGSFFTLLNFEIFRIDGRISKVQERNLRQRMDLSKQKIFQRNLFDARVDAKAEWRGRATKLLRLEIVWYPNFSLCPLLAALDNCGLFWFDGK